MFADIQQAVIYAALVALGWFAQQWLKKAPSPSLAPLQPQAQPTVPSNSAALLATMLHSAKTDHELALVAEKLQERMQGGVK